MNKPIVAGLACALLFGLGTFNSLLAQPSPYNSYLVADVTVVAIAPDGTSGTATDSFTHIALAGAIKDCKRQQQNAMIGCGYRSTFVRQGWSLLFRCGTENVLVAEKELADAEAAALLQERELRGYVPTMPTCVRTLTVDPNGTTVAIVPKAPGG
jgi:hypothetical protein